MTLDAGAEPGGRDAAGRSPSRARHWLDFRKLWAAHTVSTAGDQLTLVALPLATYAETGNAVAVGIVASAEAVTAVLLGLVAGALADRLPQRRVLVWTDIARAAVLLALAGLLVLPGPALPELIVAALALGAARVLHDAAAGAALPVVVDDADLLAANGRMQASEAASTAVGPAVAGALVAAGGAALAFLVDAVSFLTSGAWLSRVRRLDDHDINRDINRDIKRAARSLRSDVLEGLRALWRDTEMLRVLVLLAAINVMSVCVEAQFIPYASEVLDIDALGIGAYFALGGTVAVVTSILVGRTSTARGDALLLGLAVYAAGVLAAGAAPSLGTAALAFVGAGFGSALAAAHAASLRQRRFSLRMQGRVTMAVRTVILGLLPIPLVAGGWLAGAAGPGALFVLCAGVGIAVTIWGFLTGVRNLRA